VTGIFEIAEKNLVRRQQLPEKFGPDALRPSYDGLGLANIAALVTEWMAPDAADKSTLVPFRPELLDAPEVVAAWNSWQAQGPINHVVLLLMDALGYDQLQTLIAESGAPNLAKATASPQAFFVPATSVYPSTTTTALTSTATACAPAQHGMMATQVYMREIGSVVNFIHYRPTIAPGNAPYSDAQLDPDTLIPVPNVSRKLEQAGVQCEIINLYMFKDSSISRYTTVGSRAAREFYHGYVTAADGFSQLRRRLESNSAAQRRSFTYMYVPNVDSLAHTYGPLSPSYRAEVAALDFALGREVLEPLAGRSDVALLLVADHGQRYSYQDKTLWLDQHPDLARMLQVPMSGEARVGYLHLKHGSEAAALDYVERHFGEQFLALSKADAIKFGLFGLPGEPLGPECFDRIGDVLLIPKTDWICRQLTGGERGFGPVGVHAGLSRAEMLIPFLAYRFGK
jgi:hypothetical protein